MIVPKLPLSQSQEQDVPSVIAALRFRRRLPESGSSVVVRVDFLVRVSHHRNGFGRHQKRRGGNDAYGTKSFDSKRTVAWSKRSPEKQEDPASVEARSGKEEGNPRKGTKKGTRRQQKTKVFLWVYLVSFRVSVFAQATSNLDSFRFLPREAIANDRKRALSHDHRGTQNGG